MAAASTENRSPLGKEILKSNNSIMKSHSPHFYALSILFLLPIFFTLVVYPSFHFAHFHPQYNFYTSTQLQFSNFEIIVFLMLNLLLLLFYHCAIATITYSAIQVSYNRPINLVSSIKSIRNSFFPLLSTFIISLTIFISVFLVFTLVFYFVVQILQSLGLKYNSNLFWFLLILVIVAVLLCLQVNWSLAYVIAVVESKCGFVTLRRSAYLVKGIRWVALLNVLSYGLLMGLLVVSGSTVLVIVDAANGNQWRSLGVIWQTVQCSVLGFLMMNYYLLGNVATYTYCKGFNGEKSPLEIGDKFAGASEYVSIPLDDEKKNHAVMNDLRRLQLGLQGIGSSA